MIGACDLEDTYSTQLRIDSVPMNFEEPAGTVTHDFYGTDGEVVGMSGVIFFRRMDTCNYYAGNLWFEGGATDETQVGPNPVDQSENPQCYVFRACYANYSPNGDGALIDSHYSNEIAVSVQEDGSLYWTYVSCYQVPLFQPTFLFYCIV
jgi:hypothetical protein